MLGNAYILKDVEFLIKFISTPSRRKLLSGFWANVAVAWFVAAFISEGIWLTRLVSLVNMVLSLAFAMILENR